MQNAGANPQASFAQRRKKRQFATLSPAEVQCILSSTAGHTIAQEYPRDPGNRLTGGSIAELFLA